LTDPQEETLWRAKEDASAVYAAHRAERDALDQQLRRIRASGTLQGRDMPVWLDLVAQRDQAREATAAARDAAEQAADRWYKHATGG
jgi:hypothetical protein